MRRRLVLVGGGVRSGKSAFALSLARRIGPRRVFVATAEALDDEMRERAIRHAAERGTEFTTVEAPLDLSGALRRLSEGDVRLDVVVVDCVTMWLSNLLLRGDGEGEILARVDELVSVMAAAPFDVVLVTNEVGMGVVPDSALGRAFRDVVGRVHQRLASSADELYLGAMGVLLRIRPDPVTVVAPGGGA